MMRRKRITLNVIKSSDVPLSEGCTVPASCMNIVVKCFGKYLPCSSSHIYKLYYEYNYRANSVIQQLNLETREFSFQSSNNPDYLCQEKSDSYAKATLVIID